MNDNLKLALSLIALVLSMVFLSFASAPIYALFCKVTGFGGTTQQNILYKVDKGARRLQVEFDSNVDINLPWKFFPKQRTTNILTGENNIIFYEAENFSNKDIIGTSIYNVTPDKAGKYFVKIHCFCFEEQLLKAGQKVLMPVSFYIDPAFDNDKDMDDVDRITLSYSFFRVREIDINK